MKRFFKSMALALGIMLLGIGVKTAYAAPLPVESLSLSQNCDHVVLIVGHKSDPTKVTVNDYVRQANGGWSKKWGVNGVAGKNGITLQKQEGDGKTPAGVYSPAMTFGLKENPGSKVQYHSIQAGDMWVDDPASGYYNQLVNTAKVTRDWNSAEDMAAAAPYYNYGIALDYNVDRVPNLGSAIFIHCTKTDQDAYSAGCIRIPEDFVKKLISEVDDKTKIVIIQNVDHLRDY